MKRPQNGTETKVTHSRVEVSRLLISFPYLELLHTIVTFPYSYIYPVTQCDIIMFTVPRSLGYLVLKAFLLYRHECFTGKYTTRKIHTKLIRESSSVFSISSLVRISMISLLYVFIRWCTIETSSSLPQKCSVIFGNRRASSEFSENVRKRLCDIRTSFRESLEIFGKWSKTPSSGCLYNKKNISR